MLLQTAPQWGLLFEWIYQHVGIIGYPTVVVVMWRIAGIFNDLKTQTLKTIGQIDHMATNHFPHMQQSLQKQDGYLESMDQSLKVIAERTPEKVKRASKKI